MKLKLSKKKSIWKPEGRFYLERKEIFKYMTRSFSLGKEFLDSVKCKKEKGLWQNKQIEAP